MKTLILLASNQMRAIPVGPLLLISLLVLLSGCQSARNAADRFSVDRRDVLVESLDHTHQSLLDVHQSFVEAKSGLDEFGGQYEIPLRQRHEWLGEQYVRCEKALDEAGVEINDLEGAARRFFLRWESELFDYSDPAIRDASRLQLNQTRHQYDTVIRQVKKSQNLANGTLDAFRDYLYFMRHNLNDQAFAALQEPGVDLAFRMENLLTDLASAAEATAQLSSSLRVH